VPGSKPGTTTPSPSSGPRPPNRSWNHSDDFFNELLTQDTSVACLKSTLDLGDQLVWGLGPGEWCGAVVVGIDESPDRVFEVVDADEAAAADGLAGDDAEEDLDHVQPGAAGRGVVQGDPLVLGQPGSHVGMLVGGVVVADDVQLGAGMALATCLRKARNSTLVCRG